MRAGTVAIVLGILAAPTPGPARADDPAPRARVHIDRIEIDANFPGAYQVEVADVDGDGRPDLVALGGAMIAWYRNPTWARHVIAAGGDPLRADIISSATADLDGDGRAEVAIACDFAMDTPTRGQLWLASQGARPTDPWTLRKVADMPSIHRIRWADVDLDGRPELIVAPIFGPGAAPPAYDQDPARIVELRPDPRHPTTGPWAGREICRRPVAHAIEVLPAQVDPRSGRHGGRVTVASNAGLSIAIRALGRDEGDARWELLRDDPIAGAPGPAPRRGCSDVRTIIPPARQPASFATIEPWHGSELVLWAEPKPAPFPSLVEEDPAVAARRAVEFGETVGQLIAGRYEFIRRTVIDSTLDDGHALWTADVDGDGAAEIFAGHRGKDHRVAMYRFDGATWERTVVDAQIAAQDLRGGDLDGDGVPDIVAAGGATHNVVWYRPSRLAGGPAAPAR